MNDKSDITAVSVYTQQIFWQTATQLSLDKMMGADNISPLNMPKMTPGVSQTC